jgi:hypothetical protein
MRDVDAPFFHLPSFHGPFAAHQCDASLHFFRLVSCETLLLELSLPACAVLVGLADHTSTPSLTRPSAVEGGLSGVQSAALDIAPVRIKEAVQKQTALGWCDAPHGRPPLLPKSAETTTRDDGKTVSSQSAPQDKAF